MTEHQFKTILNDLAVAQLDLDGLRTLFGYKKDSMVLANKSAAIGMADCIIDIMTDLKKAVQKKN